MLSYIRKMEITKLIAVLSSLSAVLAIFANYLDYLYETGKYSFYYIDMKYVKTTYFQGATIIKSFLFALALIIVSIIISDVIIRIISFIDLMINSRHIYVSPKVLRELLPLGARDIVVLLLMVITEIILIIIGNKALRQDSIFSGKMTLLMEAVLVFALIIDFYQVQISAYFDRNRKRQEALEKKSMLEISPMELSKIKNLKKEYETLRKRSPNILRIFTFFIIIITLHYQMKISVLHGILDARSTTEYIVNIEKDQIVIPISDEKYMVFDYVIDEQELIIDASTQNVVDVTSITCHKRSVKGYNIIVSPVSLEKNVN